MIGTGLCVRAYIDTEEKDGCGYKREGKQVGLAY